MIAPRAARCSGWAGNTTTWAPGALAFQPLARIDEPNERAWAAEWLGDVLARENIEITPEVKAMVWSALSSLASAPLNERTLTGLSLLLQSNALRQALQPYTLNGPHGRLLDADHDRLSTGDVQGFEIAELMHTPSAVAPVLTYLFHRLEERFDGLPTVLALGEAWTVLEEVQQQEAFLTRTVLNLSIDLHRKSHLDLYSEEPLESLSLVDIRPTPDEDFAVSERLTKVGAVLDTLGPRTREVFLMHRVEGYGCAHIAQHFGISLSAVEKHIARAVLSLMDVVEHQ